MDFLAVTGMYHIQADHLLSYLRRKADRRTRDWWARYVKDGAPFIGVKMADIRAALHQWYEELIEETLDGDQQVDLALALVRREYTEEKLAGILFLQEILLPSGDVDCEKDLARLGGVFAPGGITDWNVCDWFCVKVLSPLIAEGGPGCARRVSAWREAENLWQARASVVSFVNAADNRGYYALIEESCRVLIRREERFAKTAVGWILREISKHDTGFVEGVIEDSLAFFSLEGLRNATKYLDGDAQAVYERRLGAA
jgi:3-methyladenine DNA glycosylase AlkD